MNDHISKSPLPALPAANIYLPCVCAKPGAGTKRKSNLYLQGDKLPQGEINMDGDKSIESSERDGQLPGREVRGKHYR